MSEFKLNHEAWARSMIGFIRERELESEFQGWCGGWPCRVASPDEPPPPLHREPIEADLLDRAELAWQRFFYPANDCFTGDLGDKLPSVDLEVADCLRLLLAAVGRQVVTPKSNVSASSIPANNGPIEAWRVELDNFMKVSVDGNDVILINEADEPIAFGSLPTHRLAFSTPAASDAEALRPHIEKLRRCAPINDDMGRVVNGQTEAMREIVRWFDALPLPKAGEGEA
jgi:hypothetical protein